MPNAQWVFSPLSCSLMSLLASRTHEWKSWAIAEGGRGPVAPENIEWVELSIESLLGKTVTIKTANLEHDRAVELYQNVIAQPVAVASGEKWNLAWESDSFLSQIDRAALPKVTDSAEWKLVRGSEIKPTLYLK